MSPAPSRAWLMVGCAFVALTLSNGLTLGGLSVFDEALLAELNVGRGDLKLRDFLTFAVAGALGPLVGGFTDRHGVRAPLVLGSLLLAGGLFAYAHVGHLAHVYAIHVGFGVALACAGLVVNVTLVSRWFSARRGAAVGLALVGTSFGNVLFPRLNQALTAGLGWQDAFRVLALFPLVLVPLALLVVRDRPRPHEGAVGGGASIGVAEALRSRDFWALAFTATASFYVVLAVAGHFFLHLRGLGLSETRAASGLSLFFLMGLVGKLVLGILADRVGPRRVLVGALAAMLVGTACLSSLRVDLVWVFAVVFGLGWGGLYTALQLIVFERFGLLAAGRLLGTMTLLDAVGGGLGPWLTGVLYDQSGSYRTAFLVMVVLIGTSLLLALGIGRRPGVPTTSFSGPEPAV